MSQQVDQLIQDPAQLDELLEQLARKPKLTKSRVNEEQLGPAVVFYVKCFIDPETRAKVGYDYGYYMENNFSRQTNGPAKSGRTLTIGHALSWIASTAEEAVHKLLGPKITKKPLRQIGRKNQGNPEL